jgi:addiction module RelE/StbE family toxin
VTRLDWARSAIDDLDRITDYLDREAPGVSGRMIDAVEYRTVQLYDFPYLGEFVPELGLRKLALRGFPYLLLYDVAGAAITIIRIHHSAEDWWPR